MKNIKMSFEEKLRALYDLQFIHTQLDKIRNTKEELPLEVEDLEKEILKIEKKNLVINMILN